MEKLGKKFSKVFLMLVISFIIVLLMQQIMGFRNIGSVLLLWDLKMESLNSLDLHMDRILWMMSSSIMQKPQSLV